MQRRLQALSLITLKRSQVLLRQARLTYTHAMNKATAIKRAGSITALASLLNIKRQAVSKWPEEVPPLRVYQLKELRPEWFAKGKK